MLEILCHKLRQRTVNSNSQDDLIGGFADSLSEVRGFIFSMEEEVSAHSSFLLFLFPLIKNCSTKLTPLRGFRDAEVVKSVPQGNHIKGSRLVELLQSYCSSVIAFICCLCAD